MQINSSQHLEAAQILIGRSRDEAKTFLERLQARSSHYTIWGDLLHNSAVLVIDGAGSVATFLSSAPNFRNRNHLLSAITSAKKDRAKQGISIAHSLLGTFDHASIELFESAGFTKLATLQTMEWKNNTSKTNTINTSEIQFIDASKVSKVDLCKILEQTYEGSLDCPSIYGLRKVEDIFEGHRGVDGYDPALWFLIHLKNKPVGVLFLHQPKGQQFLELDYLGITPWARRSGVGQEAIKHAVNQAIDRRCNQILLAVDDTNEPAIRLYEKAKFHNLSKRVALFCPLA